MTKDGIRIVIEDVDSGEPNGCWNLDDNEQALRFGQYLYDNVECDGEDNFVFKKVSKEEWDKIDEAGRLFEERGW